MKIYSRKILQNGYKNLDSIDIDGQYFVLDKLDFTFGEDTIEIAISKAKCSNDMKLLSYTLTTNDGYKDVIRIKYGYNNLCYYLGEVNDNTDEEDKNNTGEEDKNNTGECNNCKYFTNCGKLELIFSNSDAHKQYDKHKVGIDNTIPGAIVNMGVQLGRRYCYVNNYDDTTILHGFCAEHGLVTSEDENKSNNLTISDGVFYLFGNDSRTKFTGSLYGFIMKHGDDIIYDLVPVQRRSDGVYGLLNRVTNKFYEQQGVKS